MLDKQTVELAVEAEIERLVLQMMHTTTRPVGELIQDNVGVPMLETYAAICRLCEAGVLRYGHTHVSYQRRVA